MLRSALLEGVDLTFAITFADPWSGGALVRARLAHAQLRLRCIEGVGGGCPSRCPTGEYLCNFGTSGCVYYCTVDGMA